MSALIERVDQMQRRHAWLSFPLAVIKKFGEDRAGNLAALVSYYAIFSIFPLLLALSTALGFVLAGHPAWQQDVTNSALSNIPLIGSNQPPPQHGNLAALIVGGALALWSGLAVAKTAQTAFNTVYLVAKTDEPSFLKKTLRAIGLVVVGGLGLILTTIISSAVTSVSTIGSVDVGIGLRIAGTLVAIGLNTALFLLLFQWLTVRDVTWRDALPGAAMSAVALQILQLVASWFINYKLKNAQTTYGNFASVIVLLTWFYLQAQVVLLAAEVNVVRQYRLWPRALADPPATEADFRAYEAYAERERYQDEEDVDTAFPEEPGGQVEPEQRAATREGSQR